MLFKSNVIESCVVRATDGELSKVKDLYFDSEKWVIRYLVIDTLKWLPGLKVLVSPSSFDSVDLVDKRISILATKEQIENSPSIEEHQPLSRQKEVDLHNYYGWAPYWIGSGLWGMNSVPSPVRQQEQPHAMETDIETDPALRSVNEMKGQVTGYTDGHR